MATQKKSMFQMMYEIYRKEGFLAYYKGMLPPLLCSLPLSAVTFSAYESSLRFLKADQTDRISFKHTFIGGMVAGFVQSFIACPADVIKCTMQMQFSWLPSKYKNSFDCFK